MISYRVSMYRTLYLKLTMCKKVEPTYFVPFFQQLLLILLIITFHQKKGTYINCSKLPLPLPDRVVSQDIKVIPPKLNNDDKMTEDDLKVYKALNNCIIIKNWSNITKLFHKMILTT